MDRWFTGKNRGEICISTLPSLQRSTALSPRSSCPREKAVPVIGPVTEAWSSPRHKEIPRVEQEVRSKSAAMCRYLEARKHPTAEGRSWSCPRITSLFLFGSMNSIPLTLPHSSMLGSYLKKIPGNVKLFIWRPLKQLRTYIAKTFELFSLIIERRTLNIYSSINLHIQHQLME